MFEVSVACKYLIPRWRQLSVSIISVISTLVISLVVWLIVVFFSVTDGLEKNWVHKLTALTAPVRVTPTPAYYSSYYYLVDSISETAGYALKTLQEKKDADFVDPYNALIDEEIPSFWSVKDTQPDHSLKDLVKLLYESIDTINNVPGLIATEYQLTGSEIHLKLNREAPVILSQNLLGQTMSSEMNYPTYIGNFDENNPYYHQTLLPTDAADVNNTLKEIALTNAPLKDSLFEKTSPQSNSAFQKRLKSFFDTVVVRTLSPCCFGWTLPKRMLPPQAEWNALAIMKENQILRILLLPTVAEMAEIQKQYEDMGLHLIPATISIDKQQWDIELPGRKKETLSHGIPFTLPSSLLLKAELDKDSLKNAKSVEGIKFHVEFDIQGIKIKGRVPFRGLDVTKFETLGDHPSPFWLTENKSSKTYQLPKDLDIGDGVLLPRSFKEAGALVGDRGYLSYYAGTTSTVQEQKIPIFVAGFYDPGIIPIGGKFILAPQEITSLIRSSHQQEDKTVATNGINIRFNDISHAKNVKNQLVKQLQSHGIDRYWNVETYHEYDFTKEIIQELQSQKNLFLLIAVVIIVVACSNIISMLIILVNDKKTEIGILRSMGATAASIVTIFAMAGAIIGVFGSLLGIALAIFTLHYLDRLIMLLSQLQGHEFFNATFYGQVMPNEISMEALLFVFICTACTSLVAGIVPAIKACSVKPSQILRSGSA